MPETKGNILKCDLCGKTEIAEGGDRWSQGKEGRVYCPNCAYEAEQVVALLVPNSSDHVAVAMAAHEVVDIMLCRKFLEQDEEAAQEEADRIEAAQELAEVQGSDA